MKKFKYLLIILILITVPCFYIQAEELIEEDNVLEEKVNDNSGYKNTCERIIENNYGINKKWEMDDEKIKYAINTPCVNAKDLIYDFSNILTDEEELKLKELFLKYKNKYNMDIVFFSYNLPYSYDSLNEEFEADFYDFNDFGIDYELYDGIIIFRNTYESDPYYQVLTFGSVQEYIYDTRLSDIEDNLYYNIHNEYYYDAVNQLLDYIDKYYSEGKLKGYVVNSNGYLVKTFIPNFIAYFIISFIISLIFILIAKSKHKMVKISTEANNYLDSNSFSLTNKTDRFITSHTSSYKISSDSSSGGGHSSFGGHSGGGHSSGGGRHG